MTVFFCIAVITVINAVDRNAWTMNAERNVKGTMALIQSYRDDNGSFPKSLNIVFENPNFLTAKDLKVISGCSENHYDYQTLSNGFTLAVVRDAAIFHPEWGVSETFVLPQPHAN